MPHKLLFLLPTILLSLTSFADAERVPFQDVQSILAKRCFACHGPADQEAGLALDKFATATQELESGDFAVVPGDPEKSQLLARITAEDPDVRMPPEGKPLSTGEITTLTRWIEQGAEYERHWSFVRPQRQPIPEVTSQGVENAIDHFVIAKLEEIDLTLSAQADPGKLIRRLYLDLIGLLPPPKKTRDFVHGEISYSQVVDELLASKHFGERWGRHWLDLARYADTFGYERDDVRPNAWRYRDWVVNSYNRNQPYDEFLIEQLAGDLLDSPTLGQRIATGLHRMNIHNNESGINREDYRNREMVDRVNTTSTAMLGLTLGCCQCHSHKYDPLTQADYYSFYAFFNNLETKDAEIEGTEDEKKKYASAKREFDAKKKRLDDRGKLLGELRKFKSFSDWHQQKGSQTKTILAKLDLSPHLQDALRAPNDHISELTTLWNSLPARSDEVAKARRQLSVQQRHLPKPYIMQLEERTEKRRPTHILVRGDFKQKGDRVEARTPEALPPFSPRDDQADRLDLAHWIADRNNPLTARVAVNHIWRHLFGRGIVPTVDDFGTQGEPPTHPHLLDWLAVQFMDSGWDRKQLVRTIVHSATYRQSSQMRHSDHLPHQIAFGPDNPLFARQTRMRVEAEIIRDIFLDASRLIHLTSGGPTIHPVAPSAIRDLGYKYKTRWIVSDRPDRYRRALYIHFKRTNPYPTLIMFDGPESNVCQASRNRSNTPLQALATLNDPVFVECAQALGQNIAQTKKSDDIALQDLARHCFSREFETREIRTLSKLLRSEREWYRAHPAEAEDLIGNQGKGTDSVHRSETAAWISVARAVLNLDEFITRE